jgi:aryl-alcohol dehydrogenase-like predicted oxidoreductase
LGGAQFGNHYGVRNALGPVGFDPTKEVLRTAWKNGINRIDTAANYGRSEEYIGRYLRNTLDQSWIVTTKVSCPASEIEVAVKRSIERLGQHPNLLLAHNAKQYLLDSGFRKQLRLVAKKYKIEEIGVSFYDPAEILVLGKNWVPDVIQIPINILDNRFQESGCLDRMKELGVSVHARSVFLQGLLFLPQIEIKRRFPSAELAVDKLNSIASAQNVTVPGLSLLSVWANKAIDIVILGASSTKELVESIHILERFGRDKLDWGREEIGDVGVDVIDPRLWNKK